MANTTDQDVTIKVDNAAGSLTDITAYLSSSSLRAVQSTIEDTGMGEDEQSYLFGNAGASMPLAGMVNTTTDGIFGPLIGNRTTVQKTFQYTAYSGRTYRGEVLVTSVEYSGGTNSLQTFSAEAVFDGAITRTSVAL